MNIKGYEICKIENYAFEKFVYSVGVHFSTLALLFILQKPYEVTWGDVTARIRLRSVSHLSHISGRLSTSIIVATWQIFI
jgi:hypothetical protein